MLDMKLSMDCIKQIQSNYREYFYNSEIFYCKDTMLYHHKKEYYHDTFLWKGFPRIVGLATRHQLLNNKCEFVIILASLSTIKSSN